MLATHCGYLETTINLMLSCFLTSSLIFRDNSSFTHLNFCLTGGHFGFSGNLFSTIFTSSPGISRYDQAKASIYSCKRFINLLRSFSLINVPSLASFFSSSIPKLFISTSSSWGQIFLVSFSTNLNNFEEIPYSSSLSSSD